MTLLPKHTLICLPIFALSISAKAQEPFATLSTADARVTGLMEVSGANVHLLTDARIRAFDHTAHIALARGGSVDLCSTSEIQLLHSGSTDGLQFALDRGAMEVRSLVREHDAILTPDLRFSLLTKGTLDLRVRVTRNGDTCVDNRGDNAPVMQVVETFGNGVYHLAPNQHVLFEHGSTRSVVDKERSDCGCPAAIVTPPTGVASADPHPFPEAESAGLAPTTALAPGDKITAALSNNAPPADPNAVAAMNAPPAQEKPPNDLVHLIIRLFHKLFHRKPKAPRPPPAEPSPAPSAAPAALQSNP